MKYKCVHNCGQFRNGHTYEFKGKVPVLAKGAILAGYLVASPGWCAPSEAVYDSAPVEASGGLLELPQVQTVRGGIKHKSAEPAEPVKKLRKDATPPLTLEELSEASAAALDGLRGPGSS